MKVVKSKKRVLVFFLALRAYFRFFQLLLWAKISITCELLTVKALVKQVFGMPARKMRVEVFDGSGNRYTITFEGHITREKAVRLLDVVELLGGIPGENPEWEDATSKLSKFDRVRQVVEKHFPIVWFTSRDVQSIYEQEIKKPISLSTVSTYLSRMADREILAESRMSNRRRYKIATKPAGHALSYVKSNK